MSSAPIVELFPLTSDETGARVVAFKNAAMKELQPRWGDLSVTEFRVIRSSPAEHADFFGIDDESGDLAALGVVVQFTDGANAHLVWVQIYVRPDMRRKGHGRRLLERAMDITTAAGRSVMGVDVYDTAPGAEEFVASVGAAVGMQEHISVVATSAVDSAKMERWREQGPSRADGYEVMQWTDTYPHGYDGQLAGLFVNADEDMPFEDASFEPGRETAETVRGRLERTKDTIKRVTSVARHIETDTVAGFSELLLFASDPSTLLTSLTAVHRDHRGHALGKWLKADAILRGMDRWPGATHIQTENAQSNAPMLGINHEIGFELEHTMIFYEATVEQVREYLNRS